jgi:mannose PTS system EIID component
MVELLSGWRQALWRLLGLQAAWSYERMQGIGLGHAAEPMLRHLFARDPERYRQSLARAAGFYNANPYLAPAALGAELRAEVDGVPPDQIDRLRTALSGPLGSLGDRLFWTGLVPALVSATLVAVALGAGPWPVLAFVVVHNVVRAALARWLLDLGWRHGLRVGTALHASPLVHASALAGQAAAFFGAAALPIVGLWLLAGARERDLVGVAAVIAGALVLRRLLGPRASALRLTLVAGLVVLLWQWGTA